MPEIIRSDVRLVEQALLSANLERLVEPVLDLLEAPVVRAIERMEERLAGLLTKQTEAIEDLREEVHTSRGMRLETGEAPPPPPPPPPPTVDATREAARVEARSDREASESAAVVVFGRLLDFVTANKVGCATVWLATILLIVGGSSVALSFYGDARVWWLGESASTSITIPVTAPVPIPPPRMTVEIPSGGGIEGATNNHE